MKTTHHAFFRNSWGLFACVLAAASSCDSQVDTQYAGEPLASVRGTVHNPLSQGSGGQDGQVAVFWLTDVELSYQCALEAGDTDDPECLEACGAVPDCHDTAATEAWGDCVNACSGDGYLLYEESVLRAGRAVGETTPTLSSFPAQFSLDLLQPPPEASLTQLETGERVASGGFVVVDPAGAPFEIDLSQATQYPSWLLGGSPNAELFYTEESIEPDSFAGKFFGLTQSVDPGFHLLQGGEQSEEDGQLPDADRPSPKDTPITLVLGDPEEIFGPLSGD